MPDKKDYMVDVIFKKLQKNSNKINLEKKELTEFINFLIKNI